MKNHLVLLGDSVFDNAAYIATDAPDVQRQVQASIAPSHCTRLAIDGDCVPDVSRQIDILPADASHLVVSAGGNDALDALTLVGHEVDTIGEALRILGAVANDFAAAYSLMVAQLEQAGVPFALCTIYDPRFDSNPTGRVSGTGPELQLAAEAGLALFNDVITRAASRQDRPLIDLRILFNDPAHYANPIEPSVAGGEVLAAAITKWMHSTPIGQ